MFTENIIAIRGNLCIERVGLCFYQLVDLVLLPRNLHLVDHKGMNIIFAARIELGSFTSYGIYRLCFLYFCFSSCIFLKRVNKKGVIGLGYKAYCCRVDS